MLIPLFILFYNNKIGGRPIARCRTAPLSTQVVYYTMVDIMVRINNKSSCFLPNSIPRSIGNTGTEQKTCFVYANICWSGFFCWEYLFQKCQYICWWLRFGKLCPCNNHTTWSAYCFHTIESWGSKVIVSLPFCIRFIMWLHIFSYWWCPRQIFIWSPQHSANASICISVVFFKVFLPLFLILWTCLSLSHLLIGTSLNSAFSPIFRLM